MKVLFVVCFGGVEAQAGHLCPLLFETTEMGLFPFAFRFDLEFFVFFRRDGAKLYYRS